MEDHKCPLCGGELECLGGASAHYSNWYCKDTKKCGWQAWDREPAKKEYSKEDNKYGTL